MPTLNPTQQITRVVKFLVASTEPDLAQALARRGFRQADREEGWLLVDAAAGRHLSVTPTAGMPTTAYRAKLDALDAWENTWFDVADASLGRLFPAAHAFLFQNLAKTEGLEVVVTVRTFLQRLKDLPNQPEGQAALKLLETRGLDKDSLAEAEGLLTSMTTQDTTESPTAAKTEEQQARRDQAVEAMWAWYLDWSKTARTVIKNKNHLMLLGLFTPQRRGTTEEEEEEEEEDDDDDDDDDDETGTETEPPKATAAPTKTPA